MGGIFVYTASQIISKFFIEPIHDLNRLKGEIAYSLIFYANVYMNTPPTFTDLSEDRKVRDEVQKVFREQASQLSSKASTIPWFKIWELLKFVPKFQNVMLATTELIGLSNSIHDVNVNFNKIRREKIQKLKQNQGTHYIIQN